MAHTYREMKCRTAIVASGTPATILAATADELCRRKSPAKDFPSLAIYLLGERGRREQTHNDEDNAKATKHPPGLHHKGNSRTMADKFLCSKYRQVKRERQGASQEGGY
jgi:hypothetical protein